MRLDSAVGQGRGQQETCVADNKQDLERWEEEQQDAEGQPGEEGRARERALGKTQWVRHREFWCPRAETGF